MPLQWMSHTITLWLSDEPDADIDVEGDPSAAVSAMLPAPDGTRDVWLKSLDDLSASMLVLVQSWNTVSTSSQSQTQEVVGAQYPTATMTGPRMASTSEMVVVTETQDERARMRALLDTGLLLIQTRPDYGRPDQYALVGDVNEEMTATASSPVRQWSIALTEVARPDTTDQRLRIPGRSYADRLAAYPTYNNVPARTYQDALVG